MLYFTHEDGFARIAVRGELNSALHRDLAETLDVLTLAYCYERVELIVDSPGGELDALFDSIDTLAEVRSRGVRIDTRVPPRRVSSAGAVLAALGDWRTADARAVFVFHGTQVTPSHSGGLCAREISGLRTEVQGLDARLVALLVQRVSQVAVPRPLPSRLARSLDRDVLYSLVALDLLPQHLRAQYEEGDDAARLALLAGVLRRGVEMVLAGEAPQRPQEQDLGDLVPEDNGVTLLNHWIATIVHSGFPMSARLALVLGLIDHVVEPDEEQAGLALVRGFPHPPSVRVPSWHRLYRDGVVPIRALERGALVVGDASSGAFEHGLAPLVSGLAGSADGAVRAVLALDPHGRLRPLFRDDGVCDVGASTPVSLFDSERLDALLDLRGAGHTLRVASQVLGRAAAIGGVALDDASRDLACAAFALVLLLLEPELPASSQWARGAPLVHGVLERLHALAGDGRWSLLALTHWLLGGALFDLPAPPLPLSGVEDFDSYDNDWASLLDDEAPSGGLCALVRLLHEGFPCLPGDVCRALDHLSHWCALASSDPDSAVVPLRAARDVLEPFATPFARLALCSGLEAHAAAEALDFDAPSSFGEFLLAPRVVVLGPQACECGPLARAARLRFAEATVRAHASDSGQPPLSALLVDDLGAPALPASWGDLPEGLAWPARTAGYVEIVGACNAAAADQILDPSSHGGSRLTLIFRTGDDYVRVMVRAASRSAGGGLPDVETVRPTLGLRHGECYAILPGQTLVRRRLAAQESPL